MNTNFYGRVWYNTVVSNETNLCLLYEHNQITAFDQLTVIARPNNYASCIKNNYFLFY